ncbi:hypothetical protein DEG02_003920 [Xanthomonas vasicola]|nr:hypothetical protein KWO_007800 [Xanthomonas vasicola pv. musacearum NCPPB 4379]KFA07706.1 hypothetical protein KWM_0114345 [Xanthomonas vasicola pv. musacearum NCPPB 2005]KFA09665.1 hypothetical protein KWQ_0112035 [Xanthomonas vasicola pv. musacearum NCPPB 4380]KFA16541.1 hypothetical protein KWU_0122665 [Xanthomonas vasicola pv. musacearum NCPPB 4394]KFA17737.1 hypothetical protein A11G_0113730 [Xanthomonas vasicola pv. musacearum NCPPB 4392]KFA19419.1 hypothetical protein KWS_0124445 [X
MISYVLGEISQKSALERAVVDVYDVHETLAIHHMPRSSERSFQQYAANISCDLPFYMVCLQGYLMGAS